MSKSFEVGTTRYVRGDEESQAPTIINADTFQYNDGTVMFFRDGDPVAFFSNVRFVKEYEAQQ